MKCLNYCHTHISEIYTVFYFATEDRRDTYGQYSTSECHFSQQFLLECTHRGLRSQATHTMFVLYLKFWLSFWTETTFAQTTQSLRASSTEIAWYCLLSLLASISSAGLFGGRPGRAQKHFPSNRCHTIAILNVRKSCGVCLTFFKMVKAFRRHTSSP